MKLAFLGPHGTNSEEAALCMNRISKKDMELVACDTIYDAIRAVDEGRRGLLFSAGGKFD